VDFKFGRQETTFLIGTMPARHYKNFNVAKLQSGLRFCVHFSTGRVDTSG
jgi:hypothetical protein